MRWSEFPKVLNLLIVVSISLLFMACAFKYPGNLFYYVLFSAIANLVLYFSFRRSAIFFDTFIGLFFWLGFWFKLTFGLVFQGGIIVGSGNFDSTPESFDHAVLVSSVGLLGLLLASYVRGRYIFNYPASLDVETQSGLFWVYSRYRKVVLFVFFGFVLLVGFVNGYLGIYQRGEITRTFLPFGLNGVITWLLLFGMASMVAVILNMEFRINKDRYWLAVILSFAESTVSSVSLLSRGMVLNAGSILYGVMFKLRGSIFAIPRRLMCLVVFVFVFLFFCSAAGITYIRYHAYQIEDITMGHRAAQMHDAGGATAAISNEIVVDKDLAIRQSVLGVTALFINRWVGIEGVMAVSSYPDLGWGLLKRGWAEVYDQEKISFYDEHFLGAKNFSNNYHFLNLSGVVAFLYYSGSYYFLFLAMFILGLGAAVLELFVYKVGGRNVILCSLFAQLIAYRFMSFGYVPAQSYLLFGSIVANVILIFFVDKMLKCLRSRIIS